MRRAWVGLMMATLALAGCAEDTAPPVLEPEDACVDTDIVDCIAEEIVEEIVEPVPLELAYGGCTLLQGAFMIPEQVARETGVPWDPDTSLAPGGLAVVVTAGVACDNVTSRDFDLESVAFWGTFLAIEPPIEYDDPETAIHLAALEMYTASDEETATWHEWNFTLVDTGRMSWNERATEQGRFDQFSLNVGGETQDLFVITADPGDADEQTSRIYTITDDGATAVVEAAFAPGTGLSGVAKQRFDLWGTDPESVAFWTLAQGATSGLGTYLTFESDGPDLLAYRLPDPSV